MLGLLQLMGGAETKRCHGNSELVLGREKAVKEEEELLMKTSPERNSMEISRKTDPGRVP